MERYGIDVSHYQGTVDWSRIKRATVKALDGMEHPLEFAFIRAGICYDGTSLKPDEQFHRNAIQAKQQDIPIGVYLYSYATTPDGIIKAADALLDSLKPYGQDIPVVLDLEDQKTYSKLGKAQTTAVAQAFLGRIQAAGRPAILYTYTAFSQAYINLSDFTVPKWIADYRGYCGVADADIWQYSSKGSVEGISGPVDLNVSYTGKFPPEQPGTPLPVRWKVELYPLEESEAVTLSGAMRTWSEVLPGLYTLPKQMDRDPTRWKTQTAPISARERAEEIADALRILAKNKPGVTISVYAITE